MTRRAGEYEGTEAHNYANTQIVPFAFAKLSQKINSKLHYSQRKLEVSRYYNNEYVIRARSYSVNLAKSATVEDSSSDESSKVTIFETKLDVPIS